MSISDTVSLRDSDRTVDFKSKNADGKPESDQGRHLSNFDKKSSTTHHQLTYEGNDNDYDEVDWLSNARNMLSASGSGYQKRNSSNNYKN